jgi:hypothetical protein
VSNIQDATKIVEEKVQEKIQPKKSQDNDENVVKGKNKIGIKWKILNY